MRDSQLYVQYGMKRSGNHAISGWLLPKLKATEFNNIVMMGPVYKGNRKVPDLPSFQAWYARPKNATEHGPKVKDWTALGTVYASFEDLPTTYAAFTKENPVNILVIRSFTNMMSSRVRKAFTKQMAAYPKQMGPVLTQVVDTWKQHARSYLRLDLTAPNRVAILFDRWTESEDYRRAICDRMGLGFDDEGFETVSATGGGSSFDKVKYDGKASKMDVTNRADALEPRERALLDQIMDDAELNDLIARMQAADPTGLI